MQEQGKRLLLAVTLALSVLLAWQWLFPQKDPPKKPAGQGSAAAVQTPVAPPVTPDVKTCGPEQTITLSFPTANVGFCSYGGVLKSWDLTDARSPSLTSPLRESSAGSPAARRRSSPLSTADC